MNTESWLLGFAAVINIIMGLIAMVRGHRHVSTRYFAISAFWVSAWAVGDVILLMAKDPSIVRLGAILFYVAPMLTALFLVLFSYSFPTNKQVRLATRVVLTAIITLLGLVIGIHEHFLVAFITMPPVGGNLIKVNGLGYVVYTAFFAVYFGLSYRNLYQNLKHSIGNRRNQVFYSLLGIFLASFLATVTNLLLPLVATSQFIWLGPLFTVFYVTATTIAIVKHRLFDIRLVVARSVAYVLLLGTLALVYGLAVFGTSSFFFRASQLTSEQGMLYVLLAVFLSLTFQPLKSQAQKDCQ